jgi:hypothetical protein
VLVGIEISLNIKALGGYEYPEGTGGILFHVRKKEKFPLPGNDIIFQKISTVSL